MHREPERNPDFQRPPIIKGEMDDEYLRGEIWWLAGETIV
jgi:hypothetical protein